MVIEVVQLKKFEIVDDSIYCDGEKYNFPERGSCFFYDEWIKNLFPNMRWEFKARDDYQGDWAIVGTNVTHAYYYNTGYFGSCSYCDWIQGISSDQEWVEFLNGMAQFIKFDNVDECIEYLKNERINSYYIKDLLQSLIDEITY